MFEQNNKDRHDDAAKLRRAGARTWLLALAMAVLALLAGPALAQTSQPRTVSFPSADGRTALTGYLFAPADRPKTAPAVVLMPGQGGAYSPLAKGNYSSVTLNKEIRGWAEFWTRQGYWALVVDSFGPRGHAAGPAGGAEGAAEAAIRPFDAYGALRYLRSSPRVQSDRVALQGWSGGGSTVLAAMSRQIVPLTEIQTGHGFRTGIALSPGCGALVRLKPPGYLPYAPVRLFVGGRDEAASASTCQKLAIASKAAGGDIAAVVFEAASYDFDDPGRDRAAAPANAAAAAQTRQQALTLFATELAR
jgi:carboxymethylenebutenolidase